MQKAHSNLAVLTFSNFMCKIILASFVLANSNHSEKMLYGLHLLLVVDFQNFRNT